MLLEVRGMKSMDLKSTLSSHVDNLVSNIAMFRSRDLENYLHLRILIF